MPKKSSLKKIKEEVVPQSEVTEQESQYNVVPADEAIPPETPTEGQPEAQAEVTPPTEPEPPVDVIPQVKPEPEAKPQEPAKPKPLTMANLKLEIDELRSIIQAQSQQIADFLSGPVLKRKPVVSNGKVQIKDTQTGKVYPSENNTYQSMLKAGDLKDG